MIKTTIQQLKNSETRLLSEYYGEMKMTEAGVYMFKPGEKAHGDAHTHDVKEVLVIIQGKGVVPIDGVVYPLQTGDVVVVEPSEDHRTQSSVEDPLVVMWFLMEE